MKKQPLICAALLLTVLACFKPNKPAPQPDAALPAVGYWAGTYTTDGFLANDNYAVLLQTGGTGRAYDMGKQSDTAQLPPAAKAACVWTVNGGTVQTTYQSGSKTVSTTATLNAAATEMGGTWSFDAAEKGAFNLTKK